MQNVPTSTINVSVPRSLKEFVLAQVESGGYGSASEYIRELIREARNKTGYAPQTPSPRLRDLVGKQKRPAAT